MSKPPWRGLAVFRRCSAIGISKERDHVLVPWRGLAVFRLDSTARANQRLSALSLSPLARIGCLPTFFYLVVALVWTSVEVLVPWRGLAVFRPYEEAADAIGLGEVLVPWRGLAVFRLVEPCVMAGTSAHGS